MRLNRLGRLTMNNPARERLLLGYVGSRLEALDSASAGRTLVIGCGQGTDIEMALDRFHATEVIAIDIDPHQVERARRRLGERQGVSVEVGDVLALSSADHAFDTVFDLDLGFCVGDKGLEPPTSCVSCKRSNQAELIARRTGEVTSRPSLHDVVDGA